VKFYELRVEKKKFFAIERNWNKKKPAPNLEPPKIGLGAGLPPNIPNPKR
jgi:hypothetical protein